MEGRTYIVVPFVAHSGAMDPGLFDCLPEAEWVRSIPESAGFGMRVATRGGARIFMDYAGVGAVVHDSRDTFPVSCLNLMKRPLNLALPDRWGSYAAIRVENGLLRVDIRAKSPIRRSSADMRSDVFRMARLVALTFAADDLAARGGLLLSSAFKTSKERDFLEGQADVMAVLEASVDDCPDILPSVEASRRVYDAVIRRLMSRFLTARGTEGLWNLLSLDLGRLPSGG
ncbi:hypothetical protein [Bifidobacterium myosotis]|uniref:Uncharacterized protein n=1 Tax=Bifidobacterium myosotis TaxID=1630166 RepID=A0A5M9ZHT4_9BIFI|nr:hypothetical protein [Bifidobacterium myosotis]KAA8826943.1 hypothetical protein EMO91_10455 [Bifidobacterium myosotis]